jgi:hypothetical protein
MTLTIGKPADKFKHLFERVAEMLGRTRIELRRTGTARLVRRTGIARRERRQNCRWGLFDSDHGPDLMPPHREQAFDGTCHRG